MNDSDFAGFGLAPIKQEGFCSSYENPEISPWRGYSEEFEKFFREEYVGKIRYRIILPLVRKIAFKSWQEALLINAKNANG